jgi:hypothetical protein
MRYTQPEQDLLDSVRRHVEADVARERDAILCHDPFGERWIT